MSDAARSGPRPEVAGAPGRVEPVGGRCGAGGAGVTAGLPEHLVAMAALASVRRWLERSGDGAGSSVSVADLEMLQRFCASIGADPDQLVARCLRSTTSGSTAISAAGRRRTDQAITDFVASEGSTGRDAIVLANTLRGFLIHNGIFMQGAAAID